MIYVGVDPGLTGAIAFLQADRHGQVADMEVYDIPTFKISRNDRNNTHQLNLHVTQTLFRRPVAYGVIEQVNSMPKQGIASAFTFGRVYGQLEAMVAGAGIPYELIQPQQWKTRFKLNGKDKDASREKATRLFPMAAERFARSKDDGRAEAALLAHVAMTLSPSIQEADE